MEINVWQLRDWRSRRQIHCGEGTQITNGKMISAGGWAEGERVKGNKKKTSQLCEVWCEGRGSSTGDVSPPELGLGSLKWCLLSIHSSSYIVPRSALGTQWRRGGGGSGVSWHPSSPHPLPDLPGTVSQLWQVWSQPQPRSCPLLSYCLPIVSEPLSCCDLFL